MAFLIHPFVIWYYSGSIRERFTASHSNYFHLFAGHYLLTYLTSFVLGACIESPCMALIKLLINSNGSFDSSMSKSNISKSDRGKRLTHNHNSSNKNIKSKSQVTTKTAATATDVTLTLTENYVRKNATLISDSTSTTVESNYIPQPIPPINSFKDENMKKLHFISMKGSNVKTKYSPVAFYTYNLTSSTLDSSCGKTNSTENINYI